MNRQRISSPDGLIKRLNSKVALDEIDGPVENISNTLVDTDKKLAGVYGFDLKELNDARSEMAKSVSEIFDTPTPFPESAGAPLEVVSHQSYSDDTWYNIIGEVKNNSDEAMGFRQCCCYSL